MYAADTHLDAEKKTPLQPESFQASQASSLQATPIRILHRPSRQLKLMLTLKLSLMNWQWNLWGNTWLETLGLCKCLSKVDFCLIWEEILIAFPLAIWRETKAESAYRVGKLASMVCRLTRRWCLAKSIYCTFHNSLTLNGNYHFVWVIFFGQNPIGISLQALWRENSWTSSARPFARKTTHVELSVHWSARLTGWLWTFQ